MNEQAPIVVLFQNDLRIKDHPALNFAIQTGAPIIPLYIHSENDVVLKQGGASKWWLYHSLHKLDVELKKFGSKLIVRQGKKLETLIDFTKETNARAVAFCKKFEPGALSNESQFHDELKKINIECHSFNGSLLIEPSEIVLKDKDPVPVFTKFWNEFKEKIVIEEPFEFPKVLPKVSSQLKTVSLESLDLEPQFNWASGIKNCWDPGEESAWQRLNYFIFNNLESYGKDRDRLDKDKVSHLSPHIHFGEISPKAIWREVKKFDEMHGDKKISDSVEFFLKELAWREFAYYLLYHFPESYKKPIRENFKQYPWKGQYKKELKSWKCGQTGYPLIDAAMRELWICGWMNNRVRMIVASFLTKDLLIPWQEGANWFWDTLVDADLANNSLGWQWVLGSGADSAPYFRVFDPVLQSEKFDPDGTYIRRFVPELANLNNQLIHKPWKATELELELAGIKLGVDYPLPIIDHEKAKQTAQKIYASLS
jgi:deoxyribodipyrimidine photo-lyase